MSQIHIVHPHTLSPIEARGAAKKVADRLSGEYDLACTWQGDVLHFERSGVTGTLALDEASVEMKLKLGFLMGAFAGTIEQRIRENMRKVFG